MSEHDTTAIRFIAKLVQQWVDWDVDQRKREHLETEDGTHIMTLPVPCWPSHGQLKKWVETMNSAADEIERLRAENSQLVSQVENLLAERKSASKYIKPKETD